MVVSGLPEMNGLKHASEIARMSLALLTSMYTFHVRHRPTEKMSLRIGLHSGNYCILGCVTVWCVWCSVACVVQYVQVWCGVVH